MFTYNRADNLRFGVRREAIQPDEHNSARYPFLAKDNFPEVLVFGNQDRGERIGLSKDFIIVNSRIRLGDVGNCMSCRAERIDDRAVHTLIRDKVHSTETG